MQSYVFLISLIKLFLNMYVYICLVSIIYVYNLFIIAYFVIFFHQQNRKNHNLRWTSEEVQIFTYTRVTPVKIMMSNGCKYCHSVEVLNGIDRKFGLALSQLVSCQNKE